MIRNILTSFLGIVVLASSSAGQSVTLGVVVDGRSGAPLTGAVVRVVGGERGTVTDTAGRFVFESPLVDGSTLSVRLLGYLPAMVRVTAAWLSQGELRIPLEEAPIRMGETVVTAARREQSLLDVPVSVSAVDAASLAGRISITLEEPLRSVPGVNMMDDQINIRGSSGYSRGVGSRVLLLMDGIPLLTGDTGEIIWEMIPVDQIARIEVIKGAGSSLYGSSALGGVINIIPSRIPDGDHAAAKIQGGIYQQPAYAEWKWSPRARTLTQGSVVLSHGAETWSTLFSFSRWMDESHRMNDVTHRYTFYNRSSVTVTDGFTLEFMAHYVHRLGGNFFWWKSLRSPLIPPETYVNRRVFSDRGFVALTGRVVHSRRVLSTMRFQYFDNTWSDEDAGVVTTDARSGRFFGEEQLTIELSPDHHIVGGVNGYFDKVRSNIFGEHPGIGVAAFVQDDLAPADRVTLSAGIRLDWQRVSGLRSGSQVDPRVGVTYRVTEGTAVRASAGTGFRYPSIGELYTSIATGFGGVNVVPNPALRPERSASYEVGMHHSSQGETTLDIAVFQAEYRELIEAAVDPQDLLIRFENVERARIRGYELFGEQQIFGGVFTVRAGYTYIDPRVIDPVRGVAGRVLRFRPKHIFVGGADLRTGALSASVEYRYISRIEEIDENLVTVADIADGRARSAIHTVNARLTGAFPWTGYPMRWGCEVRNLLNYQYVELLANMAPPRTLLLSAEVFF